MMKKLIVEVWKNTGLKQIESDSVPAGMMMVEGVIGRVDSMNRNKRFYPKGEYQKHVSEMSTRIAESNGILGEMEHPKSMSINLNNVSHKMMEVRIDEDGFVRGKILLLDTPKGLIAQSIVRSGSPLPISSRGIGQTSKEGAVTLEYMSTYDLVGTAGFAETGLTSVSESLDEQGNTISEMFEYILDDKGNAIEESAFKGIVEAVEQRLAAKYDAILENVMTAENASTMISEQFTKNVEQLQSFVSEGAEAKPADDAETKVEGVSKDDVTEMLNNHFMEVQIPIIENWSINHLLVKNANIQEKWLKETFTQQLCEGFEKWMFESVLPKNAEIQETWMKQVFAKELCEGIQEWTTGDFAQKFAGIVESWTTQDFAPKFASVVESWSTRNVNESASDVPSVVESLISENKELSIDKLKVGQSVKVLIGRPSPTNYKKAKIKSTETDEYGMLTVTLDSGKDLKWPANNLYESASDVPGVDNIEYQEEVVPAIKTPDVAVDNIEMEEGADCDKDKKEGTKEIKEAAKPVTHKSAVLEKLDDIIANAMSKKPATTVVENAEPAKVARIDESNFKFGPAWITKMPNRFKHVWECLDDSQKATIKRRASVRIMNTNEDIENFWNTLNITNETLNLKSGSNAYKRDVKIIAENVDNPRAHLASLAKSMK